MGHGDKLSDRVDEGYWIGIDKASENGCHIYWPSRCLVTVKRNIYWDHAKVMTIPHEGEEEDQSLNAMILSPEHSPPNPIPPVTAPKTPLTITPSRIPIPSASLTLEIIAKRVQKLSQ
jgi:hypothetical protein